MTCHVLGNDAIFCDGITGRTLGRAECPWCWLPGTPKPMHVITEIHGGYCAPDMICGRCGFAWNGEQETWRLRKDQPDVARRFNIERVRAVARERARARVERRGKKK